MRVFMTGAGGGMGFESFKAMLPDLGKLYDLVLLLRDSEKNRKLFAPYMDTKGLTIHWGDLLNREDVAACVQGADIVLHIAAFVSPQADYFADGKGVTHIMVLRKDSDIARQLIGAQPTDISVKILDAARVGNSS